MDILSRLKERVFSHPLFLELKKEENLILQHIPLSLTGLIISYLHNISGKTVLFIVKDYKFNSAIDTVNSFVDGRVFKFGDAGLKSYIENNRNFVMVLRESEINEKIPYMELEETIPLKENTCMEMEKFLKKIDEIYERVDTVIEEGEWTHRGGIIDIWGYNEETPLRIEWDGNRIASIRKFDPITQRSFKKIEDYIIKIPSKTKSSKRIGEILPSNSVIITSDLKIEGFRTIEYGKHEGIKPEGINFLPVFFGRFDLIREIIKDKLTFFSTQDILTGDRIIKMKRDAQWIRLPISEGFSMHKDMILLTENEIFGRPPKRRVKRKGIPVDDIFRLKRGDYVVHIDYGVGVFEGIKKIKIGEEEKETGVIKYSDGGKIYVPVENIHLIDRYDGPTDIPPYLDSIKRSRWTGTKKKIKEDALKFAIELAKLYAERRKHKGFAFSKDDEDMKVFEMMFPYEETPDQIKAIEDTKRDMEKEIPMDRLVCGDVGFGKTEVAFRAAFKAVSNFKQVVVFVPTTLLALQHYRNFQERFKNFPFRIEMVSRLKTKKEVDRILKDTEKGLVDILIGTHILIRRDVKFKDLGLVIIDEEHKFGVKDKEKLKEYRVNVDILTLSATPIPRTLYMSLSGLKDISIINTPPPDRKSIITEVSTWNDNLIRYYVERELKRGGQVLFIHNIIEDMEDVKKRIEDIMKDIRIAVTHGRMNSQRITKIYMDFLAKKYDLLLSTAIVESGMDMGNVNTIIIDQAHRFGLADLYHLRGRVGRRDVQAYALLLVPETYSRTGMERIKTLLNTIGPGSGYRIAVRDLEIRGAGEIFGREQHGHIRRVGFSFYNRLLKEALGRLNGGNINQNLKIETFKQFRIPENYIEETEERIALYRRIMGAESEKELDEIFDEVEDRFGAPPEDFKNLLKIGKVKLLASQIGLDKVIINKGYFLLLKGEEKIKKEGNMDTLIDYMRQISQSKAGNGR